MKHSCYTWSQLFLLLVSMLVLPSLHAQEASTKKPDLAKESRVLLDVYGLEHPAKVVAQYLWHLVKRENEKAYELIETQTAAKRFVESSADLKYLRGNSADISGVDFIGFRMVSTTIVSFLYVTTTQDGPVAISVNTFSFKSKWHVSEIRITRKWDDIVKNADSVRLLPATLGIKFEESTK